MAIGPTPNQRAYSPSQGSVGLAPRPIIAQRPPAATDIGMPLGTVWLDQSTQASYILVSVVAGAGIWTTAPESSAVTATSMTIDPGNLDVVSGDTTLGGDLTVTGASVFNGTLTTNGALIINGDFDIDSPDKLTINSSDDAAGALTLSVDGGTSATLLVNNTLGTAATSINLVSDAGGITLSGALATADAINLEANSGGIDMDAALQINIASSRNDPAAIVLSASAGGIDILATGAATEDIDIVNTGGSVNITSTENVSDAIYIRANAGTSEAVKIHADQGTGAASVNVLSDVGGITLRATGLASADAINFEAVAGGIDADAALQMNLASSQAAADAIRLVASDAAGGIDVDCGTGGIAIDSTGAFSIDGAAASNVTTTGAGIDLTLSSVLGSVLVESTEDAALAIRLHANGGTSETIQVHSDQGTGVASVGLLSDVGGITLRATGLASADAINFEAAAGGIDMDSALLMSITSSRNNAQAILVEATAGGIDILASGASAGEDIDITATGSSINITATEAASDAIVINADDAAGGVNINASAGGINLIADTAGAIVLSSAGNVSMTPATATSASPTASATINARVFKATFTGFTTAAAASQDFTITNSAHSSAADGVFITVANAGTNDAQLTIQRVNVQTAGTIVVTVKNNGAAALNGNVVISGWVID